MTVSLGECLATDPVTENYFVVLAEGGDRLKLTCEHIGGLSRWSTIDDDASGSIRILHAKDVLAWSSQIG